MGIVRWNLSEALPSEFNMGQTQNQDNVDVLIRGHVMPFNNRVPNLQDALQCGGEAGHQEVE